MRTESFVGASWPWKVYIALFTLLFAVLAGRLFYLQVVRGEYYHALSDRNHLRIVPRPAPRGVITDRNGVVLADNEAAFMLSAVYSEFDSTRAPLLAGLLGMEETELDSLLEMASVKPFQPYLLEDGLSVEEVSGVADNLHRMGGVLLDVVPKRRYPQGELLCHLIGYVGYSELESTGHGGLVGRAGLEMVLEDHLSGEPGYRKEVVDALGRVVEEFGGTQTVQPSPGSDLMLTIDARLQRIAESAVRATGCPGAVVVLDYATGEVLCLASLPGYNPNRIVSGLSQSEWQAIVDDRANPLLGRAWAASYPPASTFKVVTAAYLLERGLIDRDYKPDPCYGTYHLGGTDFGCWKAHGRLAVVDALSYSCNIFFYQTIQLGSLDDLAAYCRTLGLGSHTTSVLPGEREGLVPDSKELDRLYGRDGWGLGNLLNVSVGEGELLTTPIQMAMVTGLFASRGGMPPLRIVYRPRELEDSLRLEVDRPPAQLSDRTVEVVEEGMRLAVEDPEGTLSDAFSDFAWKFYGKTGTAEVPGEAHAWVVGYLKKPRTIAVALILEHGGGGGTAGAPVAERILTEYLEGEVHEDG
ncbi:penicillin-binding protein 2 [Candidatus Fermentibacteria bacterium]|nr:penicillin-binding protein 2 [Candidatus Fermentibacteria bacterium]